MRRLVQKSENNVTELVGQRDMESTNLSKSNLLADEVDVDLI